MLTSYKLERMHPVVQEMQSTISAQRLAMEQLKQQLTVKDSLIAHQRSSLVQLADQLANAS